jgi:PST family polysaccharide transporter
MRIPFGSSGVSDAEEEAIEALEGDRHSSLRGAAVSGVRWVAISQVVAQVGSLAASVVMARLLTPAEFGQAAIAIILLPLSILLSFAGFGTALVQSKEVDALIVRSAGTLSILIGTVQTVAIFLLAPLIAQPLFGQETSELIQLMSPVFFLGGLAVVPRALLQRQLKFQRISIIEMAGFCGGTVVGLGAAFAGAGARSLVLGALATATISRLAMISSTPFMRLGWSSEQNRRIIRFGIPASLTSLSFWARQNADYAIVGATLGSTATGLYWRAFQWGVGYQNQLSGVMTQVAFPVLSRSDGIDHLLALRARMTRVTNVMILPMQGLIVATAPVLVPWLFGPTWAAAVVPTQLLAIAGMASCATVNHIQVMLAAGHPRPVMILQVVTLAGVVAACLVAVPLGIVGVCAAMAALFVLMVFAVYYFLLHRVLGVPLSALRTDLLPAALPTAILLAGAVPLTALLVSLEVPPFPLLVVVWVLGIALYLLSGMQFFPAAFADAGNFVARVMPARVIRAARVLPWFRPRHLPAP